MDIVAKEYDDSFYGLSNVKAAAGTGATTDAPVVLIPEDRGPSSLQATTDRYNQVVLNWDNGPGAGISSTFTEIWRSDTNNVSNASLIATVAPGVSQYIDPIAPDTGGAISIDKYYWVRHKVVQQ